MDHDLESVFTTGIEFKISVDSNIVQLGPLDYITNRMELQDQGPMQHEMFPGVYSVHQVKRNSNGGIPTVFTVITLKVLDAKKIVDSLVNFTKVTENALEKDLYFDYRRWKKFFGKTSYGSKFSSLRHTWKRSSFNLTNYRGTLIDTFLNFDEGPCKTRLRDRLSFAACVCKKSIYREESIEITKNDLSIEITKSDFKDSIKNTFYIRPMSKPMLGKLRVEFSYPEKSGFSVICGCQQSPSLVGIYHDDGLHQGMCGYVMYTRSNFRRCTLNHAQAFAIVLGSGFLSSANVAGKDEIVDPYVFGLPVNCYDFLQNKERKIVQGRRARRKPSATDSEPKTRPLERSGCGTDTSNNIYRRPFPFRFPSSDEDEPHHQERELHLKRKYIGSQFSAKFGSSPPIFDEKTGFYILRRLMDGHNNIQKYRKESVGQRLLFEHVFK